ncbi:Rab1a [Hexamita inflata]|uniref:Rab1a n=1 Tax=Hexamita inflata TaxID=28002 RepID=A0AA86Q5G1_9EUKA|nr:Rab1a [Hexamita inflata]
MSHLGSTTITRRVTQELKQSEECDIARIMLLSKFPDQSPDQSLHEMIKSGVLLAKLCNMLSSKQIIIQEKNHNMYHLENLAQVKRRLLEFGLKETQIFDPQDLLKPEPKYALHLVSLLIFAIEAKTHIFNLSAEDVEALECIDNNSTINLLIEAIEPFQDNDSLNPFTTQQNALLSADSTQFVASEPIIAQHITADQIQEQNDVEQFVNYHELIESEQKYEQQEYQQEQQKQEEIPEQQVIEEEQQYQEQEPQKDVQPQIEIEQYKEEISQNEQVDKPQQEVEVKQEEISQIQQITEPDQIEHKNEQEIIQQQEQPPSQVTQHDQLHELHQEQQPQPIIPVSLTPPQIPTIKHKLVLIGDSSTGKSTICKRLLNQSFDKIQPTLNLEQNHVTFTSKNKQGQLINVDLIINDTAGMERFKSISQQYVRNADTVLLVYSVNERESYFGAKKWLQFIRENSQAEIIAVGNMADLESKISIEEVLELKADKYMQCSALTGTGIHELMQIEWEEKKETLTQEEIVEVCLEPKQKKGCCK